MPEKRQFKHQLR